MFSDHKESTWISQILGTCKIFTLLIIRTTWLLAIINSIATMLSNKLNRITWLQSSVQRSLTTYGKNSKMYFEWYHAYNMILSWVLLKSINNKLASSKQKMWAKVQTNFINFYVYRTAWNLKPWNFFFRTRSLKKINDGVNKFHWQNCSLNRDKKSTQKQWT